MADLCLLLLDGPLEDVPFARRAQDLLRAPGIVAAEPGRRSPGLLADRVARRLARRLPGTPRVIVLVGRRQERLALALLARHPAAELWSGGGELPRAAFVFDSGDDPGMAAFQANAELWDRLEGLGIARR